MNEFRIDPELMRVRASEYRAEADAVDEIIKKMDILLNNMSNEWIGMTSEAFCNRYEELRPAFVDARDLICNIAETIEAVTKEVEEQDSVSAKKIKIVQ